MSRITPGNVLKFGLAVLFFPFVALLLLLIGLGAKNKKVIIEGSIYAVIFLVAFGFTSDFSAFAGLGAMICSAVRSYVHRDLWLPIRGQKTSLPNQSASAPLATTPREAHTSAVPFSPVQNSLSTAISALSAQAKLNKNRLPGDTYVTILETSQLLDSVVDAEIEEGGSDARFEYELSALIKEYLPAVLKGYLAIPPSLVEQKQANGKTPDEELSEQLRLLHAQAEQLHTLRHRQTSADLTTNGNFLRERFGHHLQDGFDFGIK